MFIQPLRRLQALTAQPTSSILIWSLSLLFAITSGLLLIAFGWYWNFLSIFRSNGALPETIGLGPYLHVQTAWLEADQNSLRGIAAILSLMLVALFAIAFLFFAIVRLATITAVDRSQAQLRSIFNQLRTLIRRRSPTLLQPMIQQLVTVDVPAVREASAVWFRTGPRYFALLVVHVILAFLIDPLLAALAILAALLLRQFYLAFDRRRRRMRPVIYEQHQTALGKFSEWLGSGPLATTVDPKHFGQDALEHHLSGLRSHDVALDDHVGWKSPITMGLIGTVSLGVMFASAIQLMRNESSLSPISVLVLYGAVLIAVFSFTRFLKSKNAVQEVAPNIQRLIAFLSQSAQEMPLDSKLAIPKLVKSLELKNVTLRSHNDETAVDRLSAHFHAGEIVAIASDSQSAQCAIADLLMGFGYPSQGEFFIEGVPLSKLGVDRLGDLACWVAADGPLLAASVTENLRTIKDSQVTSADLLSILQKVHCDEALKELPDGLSTLISPNDDRLADDVPFRMGLARAIALKKPIVVVQEPTAAVDSDVESDTRAAIEQLASHNFIVLLLPARSKSLWMAHQVLFIQAGHLVASGKHSMLLEQNDAYRHWSYMKFSPYLHRN